MEIHALKLIDTTATPQGVLMEKGSLTSRTYNEAISHGDIANHTIWRKIGYTPTMTTSESDIWSLAGNYVFPIAAAGMEMLSSDNTQDIGTSIFNGTSTGGSTTTLIDTGKDFTAGTPVAVGDCVILDKSGTTPEFGYVTAVTNATTLTISGGFSSGGTGASRTYTIIDKSAYTGAQAVLIEYLNGSYATKFEIVVLNGTTVVPTVNLDLFRINEMVVIATGTGNKPVGNISLRNLADTPTYGYITAGYTRSRSSIYTVPAGYTLYISTASIGYGYSTNQTHYARLYIRTNVEPINYSRTGNIFYPYKEAICANNSQEIVLLEPGRFPEKSDIKVSGISTFAGIADVDMNGWLETN